MQACFLTVAIFIGVVTSKSDYCNSKLCPNGAKHIGCENSGQFSLSCPKQRRLENLTEHETELILKQHNTFRNKIANGTEVGFSPAIRMATMTWSSELAELAEMNVKQCQMLHDSCRSTEEFKFVGQNLAYRETSGEFESLDLLVEKIVQSWYDEVNSATQSDIDKCCSSASGKTIGHFTQLVTDRASSIGCAIARITNNQRKISLVACNYAFTNFEGKKVYESGKAATGCDCGNNPDFPALCSVKEPTKPSP